MARTWPPPTVPAESCSGTRLPAAHSVTSLSWRGDSQLLASASEDGQIVIWNVGDGFPVATIAKAHQPKPAPNTFGNLPGGVLSVQFAPDGRLISVGRDSTVRIWSADGKPKGASPPNPALLTKVAVSSDGKLSIAGDYQGNLVIWDGVKLVTIAPRALIAATH